LVQNLTRGIFSRFAKGTLANILVNGVNIFGQIVLVPVFLTFWGEQLYGEWLVLYAIVGYFTFVDFGLSAYVVNRLNQCFSSNALDEYTRILHSSLYLSLVVSSIVLIFGSFLISNSSIERWFDFFLMDHTTAVLVTTLLMIQILVSLPKGIISGLYRTIGEYHRGQLVAAALQAGLVVFTVLALSTVGANPVQIATIQLIPIIGVIIFSCWDLQSRHPHIQIKLKKRDFRLMLSFIRPSAFFFLITVSTVMIGQGSTVLIGAVLGAGVVAVFVIHRTLANMIRQMIQTFVFALWPELTVIETQGKHKLLRDIYLFASKTILLFSFCVIMSLHFLGKDVILIWTGNRINFNLQLLDALLLLSISQAIWIVGATFLGATNNHQTLSLCQFASAIVGLGLAYFLSKNMGLPGVVIGLLIADFFICGLLIPWKTCQLIRQNYYQYIFQVIFRGFLVASSLFIMTHWFITNLPSIPIVLNMAIVTMYIVLTACGLGYFILLNKQEKEMLIKFLPLLNFKLIYQKKNT